MGFKIIVYVIVGDHADEANLRHDLQTSCKNSGVKYANIKYKATFCCK